MDTQSVLRRLTYGVELEAVTPPLYGLSEVPAETAIAVTNRCGRETEELKTLTATLTGDLSERLGWHRQDNNLTSPWQASPWRVAYEPVTSTKSSVGVEVVTPILSYERLLDVSFMCRALLGLGCQANAWCGLHVHVGNLTPAEIVALLCFIYEWEECIYAVAGESRRDSLECRPMTLYYLLRVLRYSCPTREHLLSAALELPEDEVGEEVEKFEMQRKFGLNICALKLHGTVEFRYFPGTLDPDLALAFPTLVAYICAAAIRQGRVVNPRRTAKDISAFFRLLDLPKQYRDLLLPGARSHELTNQRQALRAVHVRETRTLVRASAHEPVGVLGSILSTITTPRTAAVASRTLFPTLVPPDGDYGG